MLLVIEALRLCILTALTFFDSGQTDVTVPLNILCGIVPQCTAHQLLAHAQFFVSSWLQLLLQVTSLFFE